MTSDPPLVPDQTISTDRRIEFTDHLYSEGSWGSQELGPHASSMHFRVSSVRASIEWDIPTLDTVEDIGLTFGIENGKLTLADYDGVFSLPAQAVDLIRAAGFIVPKEFE